MLIHEYVDPSEGDEIALERGGVFKAYSCDVHMNSLENVWSFSSANQSYDSFDPCLSSFQLTHTSPPFHLVILQHGFQGTAFDMRLIRNALHMEFPEYMVCALCLILVPHTF